MSRSKFLLLGIGLLLLAGASCSGKGAAETAVKAAEDAVEAIRPDAEMYVPDEFHQLQSEVQAARDMVTNGDYKGATAAAQGIPAKAEELKQSAMAAKEAMTKEWSDLQASVPGMVQAVGAKVTEMATKPPKGMSKEDVADAQAKAESMTKMWGQAEASAQAGQVKMAVDSGRQARAMAEELMVKLGMSTPGT